MATDSTLQPWYRNTWPWILIAIPFSSVCVGSYFMYIATHGADAMVQEQYYAAGQSINKVIAAGQRAQQMGLSGSLDFADTSVSLKLSQKGSVALPPVLTLQLSHPTIASLDQRVMLVASAPGVYAGTLKHSTAQRWDVTLAAPENAWSLSGRWNRDEGMSATLSPTDMREAQN